VYWWGSEGDYNIMVMDLLGASLEDLFSLSKRKFSLKTILLLADQMVTIIAASADSSKELNTSTRKASFIGTSSRTIF